MAASTLTITDSGGLHPYHRRFRSPILWALSHLRYEGFYVSFLEGGCHKDLDRRTATSKVRRFLGFYASFFQDKCLKAFTLAASTSAGYAAASTPFASRSLLGYLSLDAGILKSFVFIVFAIHKWLSLYNDLLMEDGLNYASTESIIGSAMTACLFWFLQVFLFV